MDKRAAIGEVKSEQNAWGFMIGRGGKDVAGTC